MRALVKNRPLLLLTLGLVVLGQSLLWEYVRVRPDYRFIIEPWSLRGFETTQGLLIAATSAVLLALGLLLAFGAIEANRLNGVLIATGMTGYAVLAALATNARDAQIATIGLVIIAMLAAAIVGNLVKPHLPDEVRNNSYVGAAIWLVAATLIFLFVLSPVFGEARPSWLLVLLVFAVVQGLILVRPPVALAPWRSLMFGIVATWVVAITMGSALRFQLRAAQLEGSGVSAEIGDLGVTSGILLAWFGGLVAFVGAVGMWAKRRDDIAAKERAQKQQEAARESEEQLASTG